jgi:hypothetical protein
MSRVSAGIYHQQSRNAASLSQVRRLQGKSRVTRCCERLSREIQGFIIGTAQRINQYLCRHPEEVRYYMRDKETGVTKLYVKCIECGRESKGFDL